MANKWLRTKFFPRQDGATVMEGVRSDGAHIGFASTRSMTPPEARAVLDGALDKMSGPNAMLDTDKFKGADGWVEEPDAPAES